MLFSFRCALLSGLFSWCTLVVSAQIITIRGRLTDIEGGALAYVNIGVREKNLGTFSAIDGQYTIAIPDAYLKDTLTFSLLGYRERRIAINNLLLTNRDTMVLMAEPFVLNETTVAASKLTERMFGITKYHPLFHITDGSTKQDDIFEIAQVMHLPQYPSKITAIHLFIYEDRKDSGVFRVNFYEMAKGMPARKLNKHNIIQTKSIKEGWMKFDLASDHVYLSGDVAVGIEFIPTSKQAIQYEVKLGGRSRSFTRNNSLGEWHVPPHHYRMYVTALAPKNNPGDEDETETVPTHLIYAHDIADTFSIFVSLPARYGHTTKNFPVVFLLDGNVYFDALKGDPDHIIVGIGYKDVFVAQSSRERDYTFPVATIEDSLTLSGGARRFQSFLEQQLIPFIDSAYRTDTAMRTLMGHSLGGYFTLFDLFSSGTRSFFHNFVAASPSLEYADGYLLSRFEKETNTLPSCNLLITTGSREDDPLPYKLKDIMKHTPLQVRYIDFPGMEHMETAIPTFQKGLQNCK